MTFKELRERVRDLLALGGWTNTAIQPDYAYLVNRGLKEFMQESQHCVETLTLPTVQNQQNYSVLPDPNDQRDWVMLFNDAAYGFSQCASSTNYNTLASTGQLGIQVPGTAQPSFASGLNTCWLPQTSLTNLDNMDRLWRFTPPGTPQLWFWYDPRHIGLWPVPCMDGVAVQWMGIRYEPLLVKDDDIPLVPDVNCEGIALFGAWYHGKLYARGEEKDTVALYREEAMANAIRVKEIMAAKNAELVTRYVQRAPQEYMQTGARQVPFFESSRRR